MNRLILIGNGFDLAHGLKTSYKDFIEYLWKGINMELPRRFPSEKRNFFSDKNNLIEINNFSYSFNSANNYKFRFYSDSSSMEFTHLTEKKDIEDRWYHLIIKEFIENMLIFKNVDFTNKFFKIISQNYIDKNWSDIEADYYKELIRVKDNQADIKELNKQFKQIKELLREYLKTLPKPNKIDRLESIIYEPIEFDDLKLGSLFIYRISGNKKIVELEKNLLLNFNYTQTENLYLKNNIKTNHIHGSLDDQNNHMIFGYGDEEADEYKELEKSDNKGLLDNVKSINYLEASNYRNMESFIESGPYQIFIMGMSCGMADRTMLRKLFQHKNCVSVKPFYYEWKDDEGNVAGDNYTEIVQNISRCFSDKDLLRSIVVNKPNCEPLPQYNDK